MNHLFIGTLFFTKRIGILLGLKIKLPNNDLYQIPLKRVNKAGSRFWFGSLPIPANVTGSNSNLTIVVNDLSGKLLIYDQTGKLNYFYLNW